MIFNNHINYRCFVACLLLVISQLTIADTFFFYIQLKDKNNSPYSLDNPSEYLSERSIQRCLDQNITIDSTDLPINPNYIASIEAKGVVQLHSVSKWMNGVTVLMSDSSVMKAVQNLPFVRSVDMILGNVITSADRFENPHEQYGYGIPNFEDILLRTLVSNSVCKINNDVANIYFDVYTKMLKINAFIVDEPLILKVYDLTGMHVISYICNHEFESISLNDLISGMYFIHANHKKEVQIVKILIP